MLLRLTALLALTCQAAWLEASPAVAAAPLISIDHIPLAVHDLPKASEDFRQLGFTIKPGRMHADGIRNTHVKFADGAGIELITAETATDPLTAQYVDFLSRAEGPAFVSFRTDSLPVLEERLDKAGYVYSVEENILKPMDPALAWLFMFEGNNLSPTDRPEHFNHRNTATATIGVWTAGSDQVRMVAFFRAMDARIERRRVYVPEPELATVAVVANGEVTLLPANRQLVPGRPIVGVVFRAHDLEALDSQLQSAQIDRPPTFQTSAFRSIFLGPTEAHGTYLEFRQPK